MAEENKKPTLTIGIPTFNRGFYLEQCLEWIYGEINDDPNIEILVCDNCSTDNTEEIVKKYKAKYSNLVYFKQAKNEGFARNLKTVLELAQGEYINPHGDDDFFNRGIITEIIKLINKNEDVSVIYAPWTGCNLTAIQGVGFNDYLNQLNGITFITSMIINNKHYKELEDKDRYINTEVNQVYIQMELLKKNPKFYILTGNILKLGSGHAPRIGYDLLEVIGDYFDILYDYEKHGLEKQTIKNEKNKMVNSVIIPSIHAIIRKEIGVGIQGIDEFFTKYYSEEDYFEQKLNEIKGLLKSIN
ncbi:glycosyltransferase family 2 protein [Clostridium gasigenes]|uniref:glycosyltransferase family 2 protein n=1 Tax=Clostridium gasigenes TaxID=94869 RepID=UPI001C0D76F6|nr:glycosyltransferase family 2 protein [Clostridium gasigenes]MBU3104193.1 glycosyltransferase [Clostridium gasigenes]